MCTSLRYSLAPSPRPDPINPINPTPQTHLTQLLRNVGRMANLRGDPGRAGLPPGQVARSGINAQHHIQRLRKADELKLAAKKEQVGGGGGCLGGWVGGG